MNSSSKQSKMISQRKALKQMKLRAAARIQAAWRIYLKKRQEEDCRPSFGCDCGDWLCTGCDEEPYISCCMCGDNCADGDYESWRFCSRRCMVEASRDD